MTANPPAIPDYELLRLIGRGSYGDVWLARGVTGQYRAIKIVWRERFADSQPYEREFKGLREFAAVSLTEIRQLALLHVGRNDAAGFFYYVMEIADDAETGREIDPECYVPHTLKEMQARRGRVVATESTALGVELARALAGLHARGLVHRDVKPSNVIFVNHTPKLADIGLVTTATSTGTFVGTEGFVPPEGPGAPSADVFSLGKLLYELVTGLDRHEYPRLPPSLSELPDRRELLELNEVIIRACELMPAQRYVDASALLDDLLLLQAGRSMRRLRVTERRLSRALRAASLLAMVTVIAGAGMFVERRRAIQENTLRRQAETERDDLARKVSYAAGLAKSQRSLELGNLGHARRQLRELTPKSGQPELRGFEWFALLSEAQGDPADVLEQPGRTAEKARFSADGRWFAVQCAGQSVTIWDTRTLQIVRTIPGIHRLAGFSPDGLWLVGSDRELSLQRWAVATGVKDNQPAFGIDRPLASYPCDNCGVCFTEGKNGLPHALRVWNFENRAEVARWSIDSDVGGVRWDFYRAALSSDSHVCALALVSGRGFEARWKLQIIDIPSLRLVREELITHLPSALALSPDGTKLAIAFRDANEVEVRTVIDGSVQWQRNFSSNAAAMIAFAPDGLKLAIGGREQIVHIADAATGRLLQELRGHEAGVEDIVWAPDSRRLISVGSAGDMRFWHEFAANTQSIGGGFWAPVAGFGNVLTSHDGQRLAVTRDGKNVDVVDTDSFQVITRMPNTLRPIGFSDDDRTLLTLTANGGLQSWHLGPTIASTDELSLFEGRAATGVSISLDGQWLAASDTKGNLRIWNWLTRQLLHTQIAHTELAWTVVFSSDGEAIATSGADGQIRTWNTRTAQRQAERFSPSDAITVQFDPRSGALVVALANGDIEIRSRQTLALMRTLHTGSARVNALVFSSDGSRLICGATNGRVQVFATDDWRELVTLTAVPANAGGAPAVVDLSFSARANTLAAYLADGRVRVWRW